MGIGLLVGGGAYSPHDFGDPSPPRGGCPGGGGTPQEGGTPAQPISGHGVQAYYGKIDDRPD